MLAPFIAAGALLGGLAAQAATRSAAPQTIPTLTLPAKPAGVTLVTAPGGLPGFGLSLAGPAAAPTVGAKVSVLAAAAAPVRAASAARLRSFDDLALQSQVVSGGMAEAATGSRVAFDGERGARPAAAPSSEASPRPESQHLARARLGPSNRTPAPPARGKNGLYALAAAHTMGIFEDTAFKTLISVWVAATLPQSQAALVIGLATVLFTLPFIALSVAAGKLADRRDKRKVVVAAYTSGVALAIAAVASLALQSIPAALGVLFLLGVRSALLSPSKYSLLAERADPDRLSLANGRFELLTFVALISGTAIGGLMVADSVAVPAALVVFPAVALTGMVAARLIPHAASAPAKIVERVAISRALKMTMAAIAFFWFLSSLLQMNLLLFAQQALAAGPKTLTVMLTTLGLGTGIGSALAGRLSRGKVELRLVPIGAFLVALALLDLGLFASSTTRAFIDLGLLAISSGFFYIPLNAFLQQRSAADQRGRVLGISNLVTFLAIMLSGGVFWALSSALSVGPAALFVGIGAASAIAATFALRALRK